MQSTITVFTSPTCPHCPGAVKLANKIKEEKDNVNVRVISTATSEGISLAKKYEIYSVPTIFVKGDGHDEILAIKGIPSQKKLIELVDISLGNKKIEEEQKSSFLKKFFE